VIPSAFEIVKQKYLLFIAFLVPVWSIAKYLVSYSIKNNVFYTRKEAPFQLAKPKDY